MLGAVLPRNLYRKFDQSTFKFRRTHFERDFVRRSDATAEFERNLERFR